MEVQQENYGVPRHFVPGGRIKDGPQRHTGLKTYIRFRIDGLEYQSRPVAAHSQVFPSTDNLPGEVSLQPTGHGVSSTGREHPGLWCFRAELLSLP
jgi:hypothetical protein